MKRRANKPAAQPQDPWAQKCILEAAYWTTSRFLGRGKYDTQEFPTFAAAWADAATDRRKIVYAVTKDGFSACINERDMRESGLIAA